jgi:peptidoglycan/LPS O-acetylase OafA/YrhL
MARTPGAFGPDTSIGLLPLPAVMAYYAIFFGFGAVYFSSDDREAAVGRHFGWPLACALIVCLPAGLSMQQPEPGGERLLFSIIQVTYAWLMSFGLMGLFHNFFSKNRSWVRYLSDSSYWLYLVHIPLVLYLQLVVRDWEVNGAVKFFVVCSVSTVMLLLSYQLLVRRTWLGVLLNGRRYLKATSKSPEDDGLAPVAALAQQSEA